MDLNGRPLPMSCASAGYTGRQAVDAIVEVADTAAAEQLIRDREVYGASDLSSGTPQVITASAGSAAVAQALNGIAAGLDQAQGAGTAVAFRDLVPLPADDPRGAGLAAGALPLVMGGCRPGSSAAASAASPEHSLSPSPADSPWRRSCSSGSARSTARTPPTPGPSP
ncbi:hypothetical protein ABZY68_31395 [Streptomyces sp. NPDC006482]|uniref:hypothetical protein n=1 Tax=Streptomyces sp. NPDC006482 TaxID=3154306 RepID=UPI0033BE5243